MRQKKAKLRKVDRIGVSTPEHSCVSRQVNATDAKTKEIGKDIPPVYGNTINSLERSCQGWLTFERTGLQH
jgi:hypothetical protein